jgi:hypothetical protein
LKLYQKAGKDIKTCLHECAINVLKGNVPLSQKEFLRLKKYKNTVRALSKRKLMKKKTESIIQKGGFLPLLLSPIIGALANVAIKGIGKAIAKKKKKQL